MGQDDTLSIRVNGEHRRVRSGMTIAELAAELGLEGDGANLEGFGPSFAEELEELAQEIETGDGTGTASSS